jgi:hypothetical protein
VATPLLLKAEINQPQPIRKQNTMTTQTTSRSTIAPKNIAAAALLTAVATALVNTVIGIAAVAAGVPKTAQLTPGVDIMFSVVASVVGAFGWYIVVRRAADPTATLRRLVPTVLAISFIPDILLGIATAPATGIAPVLILALMHIATITIAVLIYRRFIPATSLATAATTKA